MLFEFCIMRDYSQAFLGGFLSDDMIQLGEKNYKCNQCATSFVRRTNLKMHERIHTGL